jgi:hypothetical protein
MATLQTLVRNTCRTPGSAADAPSFEIITTPNHSQKRALGLINQINTQTAHRSKKTRGYIGKTRLSEGGTSG